MRVCVCVCECDVRICVCLFSGCVCVCVCESERVWCTHLCVSLQWCLTVTVWAVVCQTPLYMGFTQQEDCSGLPLPPPGDLLDPGILLLLHWQADSLPLCHQRNPCMHVYWTRILSVLWEYLHYFRLQSNKFYKSQLTKFDKCSMYQ